jgi:formate dehydrogenase subunit gamma
MTAAYEKSPEQAQAIIHRILAQQMAVPGALLPILHDIQDALSFIPPESVSDIAQALNLSRAEVHGVITYYHLFRTTPPGRNIVQICQAEACQSMGAQALMTHAQKHLGCQAHETSPDGSVTLHATYCLGLCASSPAISINEEVHARMTCALFDELMASVRANNDANDRSIDQGQA